MTREYAELAELHWVNRSHLWGWVQEESDPFWFTPPLGEYGLCLDVPCWASFMNNPGDVCTKELDRQYIYDAREFNCMVGRCWAVFRKNIRKYPNRQNGQLVYRTLEAGEYGDEIADLLVNWAEGLEIQDYEVMIKYVMIGMRRWGLFNNGRLVGLNVGDENHAYAIYRYCIDDGTPFLNEYLRYQFFISQWVQAKRWVNDGGDLDNEHLARFKMKLNPIGVLKVYTY